MKRTGVIGAALRWMPLALLLSSCAVQVPLDRLGSPAPASAATVEMAIGPDTKYVNVLRDDIVTFLVGDKTFTWNFNDPTYWPVELHRVAPAGLFDHPVIAYVSPFRRYFGPEDNSGP
jgi:hypothetical protein